MAKAAFIKGEGGFTRDVPDVMLTEIHRQAAESAIIRLATMARQGAPIGFGEYDRGVAKMRKGDVTPAQALRSGQLICGMNATRLQLNNAMRGAAGFGAGVLPSGLDKKIICLKNQNDMGLINGMFVTLEDVVDEGSLYFSAVVKDEDGRSVRPAELRRRAGAPSGLQGPLRGPRRLRPRAARPRLAREAQADRGHFRLGDHRPQGAGVAVGERHRLGRRAREERPRPPAAVTYTAITRAERGLVILA